MTGDNPGPGDQHDAKDAHALPSGKPITAGREPRMPNQDRHLPGHRDPSRPPSSASSCCAPQPLFSCPAACPLNPVTRFAIGRRQLTMTDCDEQFVIGSLQSAHIA